MSRAGWTIARRQLLRLALLTVGLAPVVTVVLMGLSRLRRDAPEWAFWQAELIFLVAIEYVYEATVLLALTGALVLGGLFVVRRRVGASQPVVARLLVLCVTLLLGLATTELVCAGWLSRARRFTAVPDGGLGSADRDLPSMRFAQPQPVELRTEFPDPPGDTQIDLVVMGESSAEGVPYNRWVSIGKMVAWKLQEAIPARPVKLDVIARSGDTLEKQHLMLSNLTRRPDVLIVYCGHNEFYSRVWWARNIDHYTSEKRPRHWEKLGETLEGFSAVCNLMREMADRCRIGIPPAPDTSRHLVDVPSFTATEYSLLLADFRRRLDELVSYAERLGAVPILILPPANDAGFEPNRSFLPPATSRSEREAFGREVLAARRLETVDPAAARDRYRDLIARRPCFAETHFRLARLMELEADWEGAYREYVAARDLDGMPMRCLSPFQQSYRDVAAQHGCILVDGQSYFHAIGRHGLLDDELFQDAMHPSLRGQIALAQAVLVQLRARRAFHSPADSSAPTIEPAECVAHFGIDMNTWLQMAMWWKGFNDLVAPLRYDASLRAQKRAAGIAAVGLLKAGVAPEALGLANVGVPRPVPIPDKMPEPVPAPAILPCLEDSRARAHQP